VWATAENHERSRLILEGCDLLRLLLAFFVAASSLSVGSGQGSPNASTQPRSVTYCELAKDPAAYNHKLIRITALVRHGFEEFTLSEPDCPDSPQGLSVWVTYGGSIESNTIYCCPGEGGQKARSAPLMLEGVQLPLIDDTTFHQFADLLNKKRQVTVRVRAEGTFFSGKKQTINSSTYWGGFGHLGLCSIFVIQRVDWFEPRPAG
jgi:hypothetical protein